MALNDQHPHHTVAFRHQTDRLHADFTCVDHEKCELVQTIEQQAEDEKYSTTPVILEWFEGENPSVLRDGDVILTPSESFILWRYVESAEKNEVSDVQTLLAEGKESEYFLIGYLEPETHEFTIEVSCTHNHPYEEYFDSNCYAFFLNEYIDEIFSMFAGEEGESFQNSYIHVWTETVSHYEYTEHESFWRYA